MQFHYLVVGGGVIGLSLARNLARRGASVGLIEKDTCGAHASGRDSGVVHAGIYYKAGKAKYCKLGNRMLADYCREKGLPFQNIGKIVVPKGDHQLAVIDDLYKQSLANGVFAKIIDYHEAKEIEPRIKKQQKYLWSPSTSIVDNKAVIKALKDECEGLKVTIMEDCKYLGKVASDSKYIKVQTSKGYVTIKYLVNCAGVYVDKIAHDFGFGLDYAMLPFKSVYLSSYPGVAGFRTLVYSCPFGTNEFPDVHTITTTNGETKLGPNFTPAFSRESYGMFEKFNLEEFNEMIHLSILQESKKGHRFGLNSSFTELRKFIRINVVRDIGTMLTGMKMSDYLHWDNPGIFPQLVHRRTGALKQDFLVEHDEQSMHLLNIPSPGLASALAFTQYVGSLIR